MTLASVNTNGFLKFGSTIIHTTSSDLNPGQSVSEIGVDGYLTATGQVITSVKPVATFTSNDLATVLGAVDFEDNSITSNHITLYSQNSTLEGARNDTGWTSYAATRGMIVLNSIEAPQGGIATVTGTIYPCSTDGFTDAWAVTEGTVTPPSNTPLTNVYSMGTVSLNGTAITGVTAFSVNFGNNCYIPNSDGDLIPTFSSLLESKSSVSVRSFNPGQLRALLGGAGLNLNGTTGLALTFRTTVNGILTATIGNTLTITNGMATMINRTNQQGSVTTSGFNVAIANNLANASIQLS